VKCAVVVAVLLSTTGIAAAQNPAAKSMPKGVPTIAAPEPTGVPEPTDAPAPRPQPVKQSKTAKAAARPLPVVIPQQFAPPQEEYASFPDTAAAAAAAATPSACQIGLAKVAEFKPLPVLVGAGRPEDKLGESCTNRVTSADQAMFVERRPERQRAGTRDDGLVEIKESCRNCAIALDGAAHNPAA